MFKLNNKGMTTVEILVSFVLIATISISLFTTISNFNAKKAKENNKLEINTYKNLLTKEIQDDIVKIGVIAANTFDFNESDADIFVATMTLKDNTLRRVVVYRKLTNGYLEDARVSEKNYDDEFHILYGTPTNAQCSAYDECKEGLVESSPFPDQGYGESSFGHKIKDLRITNTVFSTKDNVLSLFIGFDQIDIGTRYAINIVSPINY